MALTSIDLEMMNKAVATAAKQGFEMVHISDYGVNDSMEYRMLCSYGDTDETYFVYVNPWHQIITKVVDITPKN